MIRTSCTTGSMDHAPAAAKKAPVKHDYSEVLSAQRDAALSYDTVPGFTRSVYRPDYALITAESRVWAGQPGW